jgi:hypothetical protein
MSNGIGFGEGISEINELMKGVLDGKRIQE